MINCNLVKYIRRLVKIVTAFWWDPHTQGTKDGRMAVECEKERMCKQLKQ
jgi:hypothetical protein